jgi:hypothetical protein
MSSGSCLKSKLFDTIIKLPSQAHETIPLKYTDFLDQHFSCKTLIFHVLSIEIALNVDGLNQQIYFTL